MTDNHKFSPSPGRERAGVRGRRTITLAIVTILPLKTNAAQLVPLIPASQTKIRSDTVNDRQQNDRTEKGIREIVLRREFTH